MVESGDLLDGQPLGHRILVGGGGNYVCFQHVVLGANVSDEVSGNDRFLMQENGLLGLSKIGLVHEDLDHSSPTLAGTTV